MPYDPDKHRRRSLRLQGFDYASPGAYFITICTHGRACLFGPVRDDILVATDAGTMVDATWQTMLQRFQHIALDAYVVMPNHFHALVHIVGAPLVAALGSVVGAFKSLTTGAYIHGVRDRGWPPFARQLWQRTYWDHVVRDDGDLERIREYIAFDPRRWAADSLHPDAPPRR